MGKGSKTSDNELIPNSDPNADDPQPTKFVAIAKKWPKVTFCIVLNEFCERFSYYGMRAVLTLYLINILNFNDNISTIFYHAFTVAAYTSPLLGSILADGYIGKFWTIFSVSLLYAAGNIVLAVASTFKKGHSMHPWLDFIGLFIIAMGTGGIKPCVSAFGADQFPSHYLIMISYFFSMFYFMINAGSTISMFITPIFRATPCMGQDSCYPLAFGVPAVLMIVATVFFMLGSFFYKKVPPKENVIFRVAGTIKTAVGNKIRSHQKRDHWLEHFLDTHNCETDPKCMELRRKKKHGNECAQTKFVEDVKSLVRVGIMMMPVPMFWALYDQQGSRWIVQAVAMDAQVTSGWALLPDQMGTLNAILIMAFIPLFQAIVYPLVELCGIRTTSLRRMVIGGLLAAAAFVTSGFVQLAVNKTLPDIPADNTAFLSVINAFPNYTNVPQCVFDVNVNGQTSTLYANSSLIDDNVKNLKQLYRLSVGDSQKVWVNFTFKDHCFGHKNYSYPITLKGGKSYYVAATPQGIMHNQTHWDKPQEGEGQTAVSINLMSPCNRINATAVYWANCTNSKTNAYAGRLALCAYDGKDEEHPCDPRNANEYYVWKKEGDDWHVENFTAWTDNSSDHTVNATMTVYEFRDIKKGPYKLYYVLYPPGDSDRTPSSSQITVSQVSDVVFEIFGMGGVLTVTVSLDGDVFTTANTANIENIHIIVPKNHVSILWQIPQYVIITAAEILFSITGLEFSYSQAAPSMKSVVQAFWLFTVAIGDLIIILIALIPESNLAIEMFAFAAGMVVVMIIFSLMSAFYYEYVDYSHEEDSASTSLSEAETVEVSNGPPGYMNYGYKKDIDPWDTSYERDMKL